MIETDPDISVINKIELLDISAVTDEIIELVNTLTAIGLTDEIVQKTIAIRKSHRIKLPDAVIAATAIEGKRFPVTHNTPDFHNIRGLKIIDPWDI